MSGWSSEVKRGSVSGYICQLRFSDLNDRTIFRTLGECETAKVVHGENHCIQAQRHWIATAITNSDNTASGRRFIAATRLNDK